jgi:hypothetical protein
MIRSTVETGGLLIHVWEAAAVADGPTQDAALVTANNGAVRLAAIDGCSLSRPLPGSGNIDGGVWAAAAIRAALVAEPDVAAALARANACLHDPGARSARELPQGCVVVADVRAGGAEIVRAGDCEAWLRRGATWERLFAKEIRTPAALARFRLWADEHPDATTDKRYDAEVRLWATPGAWLTAALGRFPRIMTETVAIARFDELVLASDGARLAPERLSDLDAWLADLRTWEREHLRPSAGAKMHDDLVVLRARWRPTSAGGGPGSGRHPARPSPRRR